MISPLRIARGILGTALTWSIPWALAGAIVRAVEPTESGAFPSIEMIAWTALDFGIRGAIIGGFFAMLIAAGGARRFRTLTTRNMAVIGGIAGLLIPVAAIAAYRFNVPGTLWAYFVGQTLVHVGLGACCAAATITLLQRTDGLAPRVDLPGAHEVLVDSQRRSEHVTR